MQHRAVPPRPIIRYPSHDNSGERAREKCRYPPVSTTSAPA